MYWGANVKHDDYLVQAKLHGADISPAPDDLIEFISHQVTSSEIKEEEMALFFAKKIAAAFEEHDEVLYVTVDILFTNGRCYGATAELELFGAES